MSGVSWCKDDDKLNEQKDAETEGEEIEEVNELTGGEYKSRAMYSDYRLSEAL